MFSTCSESSVLTGCVIRFFRSMNVAEKIERGRREEVNCGTTRRLDEGRHSWKYWPRKKKVMSNSATSPAIARTDDDRRKTRRLSARNTRERGDAITGVRPRIYVRENSRRNNSGARERRISAGNTTDFSDGVFGTENDPGLCRSPTGKRHKGRTTVTNAVAKFATSGCVRVQS